MVSPSTYLKSDSDLNLKKKFQVKVKVVGLTFNCKGLTLTSVVCFHRNRYGPCLSLVPIKISSNVMTR